jgi:hypothetical protein
MARSNFAKFITWPVGRLLWGSVSKVRTTDRQGKPLLTTQGQPRSEVAFGVAFEKSPGQTHWAIEPADWKQKFPDMPYWGAELWAIGHACFPAQAQNPRFAWKVVDGDSAQPNENGTIPRDQEGYPGHWVVTFKSSFAPPTYNATGTAPVPPESIKTGYYVQVSGSADGNNNTQKPGIYVNHGMVALAGYGPEILGGPDPRSVGFGKGAMPAGMSATPVAGMTAPVPGAVPGAPPAPAAPYMPAVPAPAAPPAPVAPAAPAAPMVPVAPSPGFIQPPAAPMAPPPPAAPVAPAAPVWKGPPGSSYAAYRAANWTDDQLRAQGLI